MPLPGIYPLTLYQGDAWHMHIRLRERNEDNTLGDYVDLTDGEPKAQIRDFEGNLMAEITCELGDQEDPDELGLVLFSLLSEQTAEFAVSTGRWDFQLDFGDGEVRTYLRGDVSVIFEVTK